MGTEVPVVGRAQEAGHMTVEMTSMLSSVRLRIAFAVVDN